MWSINTLSITFDMNSLSQPNLLYIAMTQNLVDVLNNTKLKNVQKKHTFPSSISRSNILTNTVSATYLH